MHFSELKIVVLCILAKFMVFKVLKFNVNVYICIVVNKYNYKNNIYGG